MKKRILAALIIVTFLLSGSVFAVSEDRIFGGFKMYTGTVWLLNDEDNTVILQNVKTKNIFVVFVFILKNYILIWLLMQ